MSILYVVTDDYGTGRVFNDLFNDVKNIRRQYSPEVKLTKDDVLLFEGGTDISPEIYGDIPHPYTQESDVFRDSFEIKLFRQAQEVGAACVGICRGAQLLCALSGGTLVQDVVGHGRQHSIIDYKNRVFEITSTHHQMMNPEGTEHIILAKATKNRSSYYEIGGGKQINMDIEPEIVWFPKTRSLAIQGHPEDMSSFSSAVRHCQEYVNSFILEKK